MDVPLYHLNAGGSFITIVVQFFDVDIRAQFTIKGCLLLLKSRCLVALPQSKWGLWSWHHINHLYVYKLLTSPHFSIARTVSVEQGLENVRAFQNKGDYPLFVPPTKTVIKKAFPEVFLRSKNRPLTPGDFKWIIQKIKPNTLPWRETWEEGSVSCCIKFLFWMRQL